MRDEAEKRIGHLYPKAKLPDGSKATVVAWLWARTVRSPDPAAKGAMVPLVSSFMLSTKEGKKSWMEPVIDVDAPDGWRFEVKTGRLSKEHEKTLNGGTKVARGSFKCILTGTAIPLDYIRSEAQAGHLDARMIAVIAEGSRQATFHDVSDVDAMAVTEVPDSYLPDLEVTNPCHDVDRLPMYGMPRWGDAFSKRQRLALNTLCSLIPDVSDRIAADASSVSGDPKAYANTVAIYLGLAIGRSTNYWSTLNPWADGFILQTFGRQTIQMVWDHAEANPFSNSTGSFSGAIEWVAKALQISAPAIGVGEIVEADARSWNTLGPVIISTDPPYYDNIQYSEISDYFYVWLRRALGGVMPALFRRLATPKEQELVAAPHRQGGKARAEGLFAEQMRDALRHLRERSTAEVPTAIYYAFKQSEIADGGETSAGWASFLQGVVDAGLAIDGTWPIRTERSQGLKSGTNVLASSIVLVCRKRLASAPTTDRGGFTAALRRELPDAIAKIRAAGVGPVDMQQSVIGPGMGVFTRYAEVLEDDDSAMPVKAALTIINRVWEELDNELVASLDAETQVALAWFGSYGFDAKASGELITMANAKNTSISALFDSGVFLNLHGRTQITPRDKLPADWTPSRDRHLTVWECVQHTARALNDKEAGGQDAAARLVAEMGPRLTDARALLDRLFRIATDKGWASEALVYNQLAEEWPHLLERARAPEATHGKPATGDLFAQA
jgi:putative DNA methylase